jgi:hypothetical protein
MAEHALALNRGTETLHGYQQNIWQSIGTKSAKV